MSSFTTSDYLNMQSKLARALQKSGKVADAAFTPPAKRIPEKNIQVEIEEWLRSQSNRCWWDRKRMDMKTSSRCGVPDFVGAIDGAFFGMEVKRPGEKPTTEQLGELMWIRKAGGHTAVVFSREQAIEFLETVAKVKARQPESRTTDGPNPTP
jgi:hypothetical protein